MKVLLDTSVLVGASPGSIDGEIAISAVSLADLHFSALTATTEADRAERLRRLTVIERTFDALPLDDVVAREYGRLAAAWTTAWTAAGRSSAAVSASDLLIAATAVVHDAVLLTHAGAGLAPVSDLVHIQTPSH